MLFLGFGRNMATLMEGDLLSDTNKKLILGTQKHIKDNLERVCCTPFLTVYTGPLKKTQEKASRRLSSSVQWESRWTFIGKHVKKKVLLRRFGLPLVWFCPPFIHCCFGDKVA